MYFIDKTWVKRCMIEIIYRNTVEQWIECASFASKKSRDEKKLDRPRIFLTSACAVIFVFTILSGQIPVSIIFGLLGIVFYFFYPALLEKMTRRAFKRMANKRDLLPNGDVKLVLNGENIIVDIEEKSRTISIKDVADVTEISECLFIEFKNKDEISLIVPINAFKSEEDVIEFKQKLKQK